MDLSKSRGHPYPAAAAYRHLKATTSHCRTCRETPDCKFCDVDYAEESMCNAEAVKVVEHADAARRVRADHAEQRVCRRDRLCLHCVMEEESIVVH